MAGGERARGIGAMRVQISNYLVGQSKDLVVF